MAEQQEQAGAADDFQERIIDAYRAARDKERRDLWQRGQDAIERRRRAEAARQEAG